MARRVLKYRGYEIEVEPNGLEVIVRVTTTRSELPLFYRNQFRAPTRSEDVALAEARRQIDQLLAL
jgi:hypothetical protein